MADTSKDKDAAKADADRRAADAAQADRRAADAAEADRKAREEAEAEAQKAGAAATEEARAQALRTTQEMEAEQPYPSQEEADRMKTAAASGAAPYATRDLNAK